MEVVGALILIVIAVDIVALKKALDGDEDDEEYVARQRRRRKQRRARRRDVDEGTHDEHRIGQTNLENVPLFERYGGGGNSGPSPGPGQ